MISKSALSAIALASVSAFVLSGCAYEFIEADGNCAEITTGDYPGLYIDASSDVFSESSDVYFDFETSGAYDDLYAYVALPNPNEVSWLSQEFDQQTKSLLNSLSDEAFLVDRYNTSADVSDSNPHRVDLNELEGVSLFGMIPPMGVIASCDDAAYNTQLGPSPSPSPSEFYVTDVSNASGKDFYPGYDANLAEVTFGSNGQLNLKFDDSLDIVLASFVALPWVEAFGLTREATLESQWYAAILGLETTGWVNPGDITLGVENPSTDFSVSMPAVNYELFDYWAENGYGNTFEDGAKLTGALIVIATISQVDVDTYQLNYSFQPAGFNSKGFLSKANDDSPSIDYVGPKYDDALLKGKPGEEVTLTGTDMLVNSVRIGGQNARIVANTATSLTIELPAGLAGGKYDVQYTFDGGEVNRQLGAHIIGHSVWTKRLSDAQAKLYAKNVAGAGKVQLMLNGKEVGWVDAIDANDPKLRKANGDHYLVRTVNLKAGKNVLEVWVDGTRERRTVYTR